jgi:pyridoxal phosphate enzyme (YggS family)
VTELAERLRLVQERISAAAKQHYRESDGITLIVVTKFHPAQLVLDLLDLGVNNFGENRDQEAKPKAQLVAEQAKPGPNPKWHFVGQLQSNKVRSALGYATTIHSLDRLSLLKELARCALPAEVFIELNLTDDPGRGGVAPSALESFAEQVLETPNLKLRGVMGVAALDRDPRIDFETILNCSERLQLLAPEARDISAGMSGDFEEAIGFGATHLRIGTAITGNRAAQP